MTHRVQPGIFVYMIAYTDPSGNEFVRTTYEGTDNEKRWTTRSYNGKQFSSSYEAEKACTSEDEYINIFKLVNGRLMYQGFQYQERAYR